MTRMRQQMETLLKRFPPIRSNSTEEIPEFPLGVDLPAFGDIDLGKGNTTSVTKVKTITIIVPNAIAMIGND